MRVPVFPEHCLLWLLPVLSCNADTTHLADLSFQRHQREAVIQTLTRNSPEYSFSSPWDAWCNKGRGQLVLWMRFCRIPIRILWAPHPLATSPESGISCQFPDIFFSPNQDFTPQDVMAGQASLPLAWAEFQWKCSGKSGAYLTYWDHIALQSMDDIPFISGSSGREMILFGNWPLSLHTKLWPLPSPAGYCHCHVICVLESQSLPHSSC